VPLRFALAALVVLALGSTLWFIERSNGQQSGEECRQRYDVATGKVYYGCAPAKAPVAQLPAPANDNNWDYTRGSELQKRVCHREIESNSAGPVKVDYCDVTLVSTNIHTCKQPDWGHLVTDKMITIRQNLQNGGDWNQIFQGRIRNIQESQQKAHREMLGIEGKKGGGNYSGIPTTVEELAFFHYVMEKMWRDDIECMRAGIIDCPRNDVSRN